jgi:chemotaxis response regulator CheB
VTDHEAASGASSDFSAQVGNAGPAGSPFGTSAGGLEALSELLRRMPDDTGIASSSSRTSIRRTGA